MDHFFNKNNSSFFLIAGPCVVESKDVCFEIAEFLKNITKKYGIPYVFKASYKKANRTSSSSFRGIGDEKALQILKDVKATYNLPILTDVHDQTELAMIKDIVDVIQIPAFLCRQTELLEAAGETGLWVNIKKGQFLDAVSMKYAVDKVKNKGNNKVLLTERGNSFGYGDLVVDFRNIPIMQATGCPVIMDVTHSIQKPNTGSGVTGGSPEYIETIAKAGIAAGCDGIFLETHPNPKNALSDGANMLPLDKVESLLQQLLAIKKALVR